MNRITLYIILFLWTLGSQAQTLFSKNYNEIDPLGQNRTSEITQDWKGQLWFANYGSGVTLYDGEEYIQFDESDGLNNLYARSFCFDEFERLWVGTVGGGINIYDQGQFINFKDSIGHISDAIFDLFKDKENRIWIGSKDGLFLFENNQIKNCSQLYQIPNQPVESISQDTSGNIWVGFIGEGLVCLSQKYGIDGYFSKQFKKDNGLKNNNITSLFAQEDGSILVGTFSGMQKLALNENNEFEVADHFKGLPNKQIFDIVKSQQFGLTVALGKHGIYSYNESKSEWKLLQAQKNAIAYDLFEDREGFLWVSYWQHGVERLSNSFVDKISLPQLSSKNLPVDIDLFGEQVLISYPDQIFSIKHDNLVPLEGSESFEAPVNEVVTMGDSVIIANIGNGLKKYKDGKWRNFSEFKEFLNRQPNLITASNDGFVWLTLKKGPPLMYDGQSYTVIQNEATNHSEEFDKILAQDSIFWMYSKKQGLWQINGNNSKNIKPTELPNSRIVDWCTDEKGGLWMAFQGNGIGYYNGDSIQLIGSNHGIAENTRSVFVDSRENVWVGTKSGLYVINKDQLKFISDAKAVHIGTNSGLPHDQCVPGQIIEDHKGFIWVVTKNGLAKIDPTIIEFDPERVFPILHIKDIKLFFESVKWKELGFQVDEITGLPKNLQLTSTQNQLTFEIHSISIGNSSNAYYRYQLEGLEKEFSPVSNAKTITYHDLDAGDYTLKIKPCNAQGICQDNPTSYSFSISKPFYNEWWFYLIVFVIVNTTFYLFVKIRDKNLLKAQEVLEQKVALRTLEIQTQKRIIEDNNQNITDSIKYAKRIQRAIIPKEIDIRKHFEDSFAMYLPKNMVSGDFYMVNSHDAKKRSILVADCTGHGVPGALMSMLGYSLFRDSLRDESIKGPGKVLDFVAKNIIYLLRQRGEEGGSRDGMDASLVEYNIETQAFEFAGANNAGFMIGEVYFEDMTDVKVHEINGTNLYELKPTKQPLGINKSGSSDPFKVIKGTAKKGTKLYLLSDGYADQFGSDLGQENNGKGKKFRIKKLREKLVEIHQLPMEEQHRELHTTLSIWKGALEQVDDITVLGVTL